MEVSISRHAVYCVALHRETGPRVVGGIYADTTLFIRVGVGINGGGLLPVVIPRKGQVCFLK